MQQPATPGNRVIKVNAVISICTKSWLRVLQVAKNSYICDTLHFERRTNARHAIAGVFYACLFADDINVGSKIYTASYPRVVRLMAALPLERCKVTGKVRPFFYSLTSIA